MSQQRIAAVNRSDLTSGEIASMLGYTPRYVRKVRKLLDLPRPRAGAGDGVDNHQYKYGRTIDLNGYALVRAPAGHPGSRRVGMILEHRLIAERAMGRYLQDGEVVDHIDGLTLHNDPANLRVFASNGAHLRETLAGRAKRISVSGRANIVAGHQHGVQIPVDTYRQRKERGDVRLHSILLAASRLGIDSPHLSGTQPFLQKAGIDASSRSNLALALVDLYSRWESDLLR